MGEAHHFLGASHRLGIGGGPLQMVGDFHCILGEMLLEASTWTTAHG